MASFLSLVQRESASSQSKLKHPVTGAGTETEARVLEHPHVTSIGSQVKISHNLLQGDQIHDVDSTLIGQSIIGRIKIDDGHVPACCSQKLLHAIAVGGLATSRRAHHYLPKAHVLASSHHVIKCSFSIFYHFHDQLSANIDSSHGGCRAGRDSRNLRHLEAGRLDTPTFASSNPCARGVVLYCIISTNCTSVSWPKNLEACQQLLGGTGTERVSRALRGEPRASSSKGCA